MSFYFTRKRKVGIEPTPTAPQAGMLPLHNIRHIFNSLPLSLIYKDFEYGVFCALKLELENARSVELMNKPRSLCIHNIRCFGEFISLPNFDKCSNDIERDYNFYEGYQSCNYCLFPLFT